MLAVRRIAKTAQTASMALQKQSICRTFASESNKNTNEKTEPFSAQENLLPKDIKKITLK